MIDIQRSTLPPAQHLNNGLFSDHYLREIVPTLAEWQDFSLHNDIQAARARLRDLFARVQPDKLDEAQLEEQWIRPVFETLGHHWTVQVKIRYRDKGYRKPDYAFTETPDAALAFTNDIYDPAQLTHVLALGDAKKWGINLDQAGEGRNPSQQIDEYLRYSEISWGILTDGRFWRLYERGSSKDNVYYAVDLPALLKDDPEGKADSLYAFNYFYLFFRRQAFAPGGWLARVLKGSIDYAEGLSDKLEAQVYEALRLIAQGFLDYRRNRLRPDAATLRLIYEESLVFLYRLLFVLYAESRNVLPMTDNEEYEQDSSLKAIIRKAVDLVDRKLMVDFDQLYSQLSTLFFIIDQGSPEYGITPYNGHLFSDETHSFLAQNRIGDAALSQSLDRLARVESSVRVGLRSRQRVMVDYRDLDVRHLGSIYEKLLEYQLDVAEQPLTLRQDKYAPAAPGDRIAVAQGKVYLRTGSNERKVTGSYYTPEYIVRFIVERTLEPLLAEITQEYAELDADGHWLARDPAALRAAILSINVLDPATGSGHFMVEAVAYIAEWLRRLGLRPDDLAPDEDELVYWKRQVVTSCIYGVDINPLAVELAKLSLWLATIARGKPLSFLDHHVRQGNSLVGARAADIGVNGTTAAVAAQADAPAQLSLFDDAAFTGAVGSAVSRMSAIEHTVALNVEAVKDQEQVYDALRAALAPWRALADVWTARGFGLAVTPADWQAVYAHLINQPVGTPPASPTPATSTPASSTPATSTPASSAPASSAPASSAPASSAPATSAPASSAPASGSDVQALLERAAALAAEHSFLHYELVFPEVFFSPDGKPLAEGGFDAVIGNPPYVRQERLQAIKPYLAAHYAVHQGTADLYLYFYERALRLAKAERRVGYITSGTFMNSNSASEFRRYANASANFDAVIDFGAVQPFKGVDLATNAVISILRKDKIKTTFRTLLIEGRQAPASLPEALAQHGFDCPTAITQKAEWRLQPTQAFDLSHKLFENQSPLKDVTGLSIYRGVTTGLNEAFVINGETRDRLIQEHASSADIIKALRRGQDLRPWYQMDSGEYLIFTRRGIDIDQYPAIKRHLEAYQSQLVPEPPDWTSRVQGTWPGRKPGTYAWYEIQDQTSYFAEFERTRILWPDIARFPRFSRNQGYYLGNTGFMFASTSYSLLAILQSRIMWFAISQIATPLNIRQGLWRYRLIEQFVERLPIPELTADQESTLAALAEELTALARQRYQFHEDTRRRIQTDLGAGQKLNDALTAWWEIPDFSDFRAQVKKAFKADIPLSERGEWERYLEAARAQHTALTDQIIAREIRLNAVVYEAFRLTPDEIALVEKTTRYPYGAV